jgi:carboxyl-terminal processing protease
MEDGLVKVVSPIEGSPAFRAGVRSGDLITRIDETMVKGLTMDQAVKRMRGEPNTKVQLTIYRKDESRSFPVTIVREEIRVQSVRAKVIEPGYGWLRVSQFQDRTVDDFVRKIEEMYKTEPQLKGLVLDLRNDPGGLLEGAVALSAAFLPTDATVVSTNGQLPDSKASFKAAPSTTSARRLRSAEAPARRDEERAAGGAGQRRLGLGQRDRRRRAARPQARDRDGRADLRQGLGADGAPAAGETALKITTARYYTPSGRSIQAKGIVPDVWLDETADGNVFAALRLREADLEKHLGSPEEKKDEAREKAREEARKRLEEQQAKSREIKPLPEFGSPEDFQLIQALNQLKGKPVAVSKAAIERKAEAKAN